MRKKTLKTMTALMSTVILGSSLFTGCSSKKNNASTDVEGQNITISPTIEATLEPTEEATQEPTEPISDPASEPAVTEGTSDPAKLDITVEYEDKDETIMDDEDKDVVLVNTSCNQPVVTIPNNEAASKKINDYFAALIETYHMQIDEYKTEAKELHKQWVSDDRDDWTGYEIATSYNMERADENCISFSCNSYFDLLGAHPSSELLGYTFNTSTGELLTLEDLTDDLDGFKAIVNEDILAYCKQLEKEQGEGLFNEGYEEEIPNILQQDTWFLDEKGFEVIANEYSIAPHALGIFNVLIPYSEMVGVKEEFIKR